MSGSWHPIHDNHAIDVMGFSLRFAEPVPELIFKRALKAGEDVAFEEGLRSRHSTQSFAVPLMAGFPMVPQPQPQPSGRVFNSLEEMESADSVPSKIVEQLQITNLDIVYRTWRYVSWDWQFSRIKSLIEPALDLVAQAVPLAAIRLEYLDRFRFDGPAEEAVASEVLRQGSWVAPQIFSRSEMWHSHTGAFLPQSGNVQELVQVHIDALDGPDGVRWIQMMTAREDRFRQQEAILPASVFRQADAAHKQLIELAKDVLTEKMSQRIYLTGSKQ